MPVFFVSFAILCLLFSRNASASEREIMLSRDSAIAHAMQHNRELAVAELLVARANVAARWGGRLDNPELELNFKDDGLGLNDGESTFDIALSQRFPITSRLRKEKVLHAQQIVLAEAEIAEHRRQLAGVVDLAVINLQAARGLLERQRELAILNEKIVDFLENQVQQGQASKLDATQAKLTGRTLEQRVTSLQAQADLREAELKLIIGASPKTRLMTLGKLTLPDAKPAAQIDFQRVYRQRPDLVLAFAKTTETNAALALEHSKRWQDVSVRMFAERERAVDDPNGTERNTFVGVGLSIPLPLRNRNQAGIESAHIARIEAEKTVAAIQFHIESECEKALKLVHANWKLATEASGEILDLATSNFHEYQSAYREGQANLLQVQRAQEQQIQIQTAALEAIAEYFRAHSQLRLAMADFPCLSSSSPARK